MDAQIFQGNAETDRSFRSVEKAKTQMMWFLDQLKAEGMVSNYKAGK
jgi:hypothetical protein